MLQQTLTSNEVALKRALIAFSLWEVLKRAGNTSHWNSINWQRWVLLLYPERIVQAWPYFVVDGICLDPSEYAFLPQPIHRRVDSLLQRMKEAAEIFITNICCSDAIVSVVLGCGIVDRSDGSLAMHSSIFYGSNAELGIWRLRIPPPPHLGKLSIELLLFVLADCWLNL